MIKNSNAFLRLLSGLNKYGQQQAQHTSCYVLAQFRQLQVSTKVLLWKTKIVLKTRHIKQCQWPCCFYHCHRIFVISIRPMWRGKRNAKSGHLSSFSHVRITGYRHAWLLAPFTAWIPFLESPLHFLPGHQVSEKPTALLIHSFFSLHLQEVEPQDDDSKQAKGRVTCLLHARGLLPGDCLYTCRNFAGNPTWNQAPLVYLQDSGWPRGTVGKQLSSWIIRAWKGKHKHTQGWHSKQSRYVSLDCSVYHPRSCLLICKEGPRSQEHHCSGRIQGSG